MTRIREEEEVSAIRIGKLENLVKHMQEKCFACYLYYPGQDIAIDETTVRSTAGWPFASTIPKSPISGVSKHMLKAYVLTDSFTGYASAAFFEPYYGNKTARIRI